MGAPGRPATPTRSRRSTPTTPPTERSRSAPRPRAGRREALPRTNFAVERETECWFAEPLVAGDRAAVEWWGTWVEQGQRSPRRCDVPTLRRCGTRHRSSRLLEPGRAPRAALRRLELATDEDRLEVLTCATAGSPIDVPLEAVDEHQPGALQDFGIEPTPVVDDDADGSPAARRRLRPGQDGGDPATYSSIAALLVPRAAAPSSRSRRSSSPSSS